MDDDTGLLGFTSGEDGFCDLRRILQDESCCYRLDTVVEPEGPVQVHGFREAEVFFEVAHQRDIATGEAVDRLPVIAYAEQAVARRLVCEGLHQTGSTCGYILEFVDEEAGVGGLVSPALRVTGGLDDHVVEVDRPGFPETGLVTLDRTVRKREGRLPGAA